MTTSAAAVNTVLIYTHPEVLEVLDKKTPTFLDICRLHVSPSKAFAGIGGVYTGLGYNPTTGEYTIYGGTSCDISER